MASAKKNLQRLHKSLHSVTYPEMNMSRNVFVARSRTNFYFSQRLRQQKNCETCSFQGMLHWQCFVQFVSQQNCCKLQQKTAQCNSALTANENEALNAISQ